MRTKKSKWFVTRFRYDKTQEDGRQKRVTEQYVVEAETFGDAEKSIITSMDWYIQERQYEVRGITPAPFSEIFFSDNINEDRWYKVVVAFISIDEKTEKEKYTNITYLVKASSTQSAQKNTEEVMNGTMIDYVIKSVNETKILDVFEKEQ